ncbi:desmoplakin isoform X1 [Perca fluviatilis]|uniref:desmoplakin isoform X1 n=1 Tax=Perca fluviatilis TaxID=8168 RepID=UPI001965B483|nr:desmoplakin isoform X1 [Perca fluviatilis]
MSMYGSQKALYTGRRVGSKGDLTGGGNVQYSRSEILHGAGNGYEPYMDADYNTYTFSKSSGGGMGGGMLRGNMSGSGGGMMSAMSSGMVNAAMSGGRGGGMMSGTGGGMMSGSGGGMSSAVAGGKSSGMMSGTGGGMVSGMSSGMAGGMVSGMPSGMVSAGMSGGMGGGTRASVSIQQRAMILQAQCQEYLKKADYALQSGSAPNEAERYMMKAKDSIEQLKACAMDLRDLGEPIDNVVRTLEICKDQLKGVHMAISGTTHRRRSTRGGSGGWEEPGRSYQDAMAWIAQQKRLIETASWGDDPVAIEQQLSSHQNFHSSIQRASEVERAKEDLMRKGDKGNIHALDQEWDSLQQMSIGRIEQLQELKSIIQDMSKEIMWVNDREEEELMFDWGDKNIDQYIPQKQESYSKLMSALEGKEKDLNKLTARVDTLLKNNHPASDKIEAYKDTLQTQWSWLLQITKCIDVHLKENAAYSQFFKEANETYSILQKEHETVRKRFTCNKNTPLDNLVELLRGLEREKEKIMENKRQVQHLVSKSKNIVRLKPRNPEEKSGSPTIVKALCDFKQDQKVICKGNEAILKDNSQRSKWNVTGPGGLDMLVPSVCLIVPPPNPLSISLANKNEQYYEAILQIWSQLYINVKSLIAWQYCLLDIRKINSLTISMLSSMRPEEYRQLIKSLETHYEEFRVNSHGSQMFTDDDKRGIENQFTEAQDHYEQIVVQLPTYIAQQEHIEVQQASKQQHQQQLIEEEARRRKEEARKREEEARRREEEARMREEEARRREDEARRLKEEARRREEDKRKAEQKKRVKEKVVIKTSSRSLSELHALRLRLEGAEGSLSQHVHICLGDDGMHDCGLKISQLETVQHEVDSMREEYLRLKESISKELEGMSDSDKAQFLRSEIGVIDQRLGSLESSSSAYLQRLQALRDMLECVAQAEDIVKVHEARLTEKETTSLSPSEVEDYTLTLKNMKAELDQKKDVLASMEAALAKASHWNGQVGGPFHRCDMMLSKYTEEVGLLSDRWRRLQGQIDTRVQDLQLYHPQLQTYKKTSSSLIDWIDATRKNQDALQTTKIESIQALTDHINKQKALNSEIKSRRETVESVLKDNEACVNSIKDYETDLASYTSGLETLLNIPIKRTMLKSPSTDLNLEATQMRTRYMELLAHSGDYYKFLGELHKNMEELKIRNTRIDLLEEELRLLRENMQDRNAKNKSLEEAVSRYQLELSSVQNEMLSIQEVKQSTALQCNATKDSLDTTKSQLADLSDEVTRLTYLLEEEKRKRRLAEERYTTQQEEYESVLRKRQKELETISWSKVEVEKSELNKEHEIQQLRRQLAEDGERIKDLQKEMSKVRSLCSTEINNFKLSYESQIHIGRTDIQMLEAQRKQDAADFQLQFDRMEAERRNLEEELRRLRMSMSQAEEHRKRAEEEAHSQRAVITEEGRRRRDVESQVEVLMRQRVEESSQYAEQLAEVMKSLQEKSEELTYVTHSLEEETRRRRTIEEGQGVLEQTLAQLQVKLTSSSTAATQLGECEEELLKTRSELERESRERSRVEENMSRLQGRMKDLQAVRDGLESQVENLRKANQEEVSRRRQVETELENTTVAMTEYTNTITTLRQSQEHASTSEKRGEEERLRLQEELERSLRQNKTSAERVAQLSVELKALQQQLLQEQARGKEANLRNEGLYRTIEEKSKTLNENSVELQRLKEMTETQTKEKLRLEEELRATRHAKDELLRSKQGSDDELSSQITALELQLQASQRSNADYRNLASELSSEREKLKLETEEIQKQATETSAMMQSIQSQYSEIVMERDALLLKLQLSEKDKDRYIRLEEELSRIKLSQESELRNKQRLQEEIERMKRDLGYWKDQYESKEGLIRQYDTDKERLEREKNSLKSEIERLMRELRELDETYKSRLSTMQKELQEVAIVKRTMETELTRAREPPTLDASTLVFDGVRKPVTANQLLDCGVLDKPTFSQLVKGQKTVPEVSVDKKISLKGTGPIAGVVIEGPKGSGSIAAPQCKMTFTEAKKENLLPSDSVDLLLDAQAATGHIIDPRTNQKLTVEEACNQGVVDEEDRERLLAAEAAAVGYGGPGTSKPLSVFQAMQKGLIDKNTTLRLLQAQESVGGILDPVLSVFLPKDTAVERNLINDDIYRALNQRPELYLDPESEDGVTYMSMKRRCKVEPHTGLLLLPIPEKVHPSKLIFDGVRKPVTAKQLLDCGVLDRPTFKALENGKKNVPEVSVDKNVNLKGTGPIAGVVAGSQGKMSLSEAKKQLLLPEDSADLLLEAQAATGHIIDPRTNQKLTVEEACARGVVDPKDRDRLLTAEAAAVGYKDSSAAKPLSVFEAMKKGLIDRKTGLRLLQAQESVGGILDPNLSVFLPKDTAIKLNLLDENLRQALNQSPECYRDPETERDASYGALKKRCKTEPHTGLLLLPITEKLDPSKLIFDGVRKPVTAQQLLDCGVLDKPTLNQLMKGEKTIPQVSVDKKIFLKGTGSIAGVAAGPLGKMSLSEAKKQMLLPPDSADLLLDAQAATGHIIDPTTSQKLTVEEACARRVVDIRDRDRLLAAEAAAVGYRDPSTAEPLSVFEAMKKGLIDRKTGLRMLQAQESAGGILDPNLSVFLPKDTAIKRNLLDDDLCHALNQSPECYIDPDTERNASYRTLKNRSKTESHTGLMLLPITERKDPSKLMFDGIRKPVSAQQLFECGVLDKPTLDQLVKGVKTVPAVSMEKIVYLKGTGPIAGVVTGRDGKMSFSEAKRQMLLPLDSADLFLEAQAATGHIIDPKTYQKLTVAEACARGVVDIRDRDRLLVAEAAAVGFKDPSAAKPLSVFEAMKKGLIDRKTGLRLLQAQESVGGIIDPNLSVFLPKDTAIKRNILDEDICHALNQSPECYLDPDSEQDASYGTLKERCKTEPQASLQLLPVSEKFDPSKLFFDGVRKTVTAQQLLDCGVLDKRTFKQLMKGEKTVPEVSVDKMVFLKGTGSIAGVAAGPLGKMSFTEAKKQKIMSSDCADMLLIAQAATGNIIDPKTNQKLTVKEACAKGVVDKEDESKLFAAEAAAIGYREPNTGKLLSAGQAMKKGLIDKDTALRILQAQESVGGILDPALSVFLAKNIALDRDLIDQDLSQALNRYPECYIDPDTQLASTYVSLKKKCKADPSTGLLLLPEPKKPLTVQGLRGQVSVIDLVDANLLDQSDMDSLREGRLTSQDIEDRLRSYLRGSTCIAGVYDEDSAKVMSIYQAMKNGLLRPGTTLELLEAQAASGFIVDPVNNQYLTVSDAYNKRLFGPEFKDNLLSAERAVTGYKLPGTDKVISHFEAIERGLVEKGHGMRLLEAQIASGGIIDPEHSHRIDVNVAYKRGYFDKKMNSILTDPNVNTKGFFDPNTEENLTYLELKKRCITDKKTGLILLLIMDKKKLESTLKNTMRKRRVVIVDPETNKEMTVREAYDKGFIDYETFVELSGQECEWEEITITAPDGSTQFVIIDRKTGRQFDITELLETQVINQSDLDKYQSRTITLNQFADIIKNKTKLGSSSSLSSSSSTSRSSAATGTSSVISSSLTSRTSASPATSLVTSTTLRTSAASVPASVTSSSSSSSVLSRPLSPTLAKMTTTRTTTVTERSATTSSLAQDSTDSLRNISSVSINLASPVEAVGEQEPVGAIFDTDTLEKITITEALNRGLVDSITAQRLLEAQVCTGGLINPKNGHRLSIQEATRLGIINDDMAPKLKPAQKAFFGFEDLKTRKKMSAAQAMKESWLPYEAGHRFLEFQFVTGGLYDPEMGCRRSIEDAVKMGWIDVKAGQKLQDIRHHTKNLTCPKTKLKISYKEALDNCLEEESNGLKMLQASSVSSRGISSPYNFASGPGSTAGSRSGSRQGSRRSSVDLGSTSSSALQSHSSFTTFYATSTK